MNKQRRADLLLVMTTFFWGASYYLTDICLADLPPMTLNAFRFIVAFLVLGLIFWKHVVHINRTTLWYSLIVGLALAGTYVAYNYGITRTSLSNAAFICALQVIFAPLLGFLFFRQRPGWKLGAALVVCTVGMALLTLNGELRPASGDLICLITPLCYAVDLLITEKAVRDPRVDPLGLGVCQLAVVGIVTLALALALGLCLKGGTTDMMTIIWIAAMVIFGVVEAVTVGLASIWFVVGSVAGLIAAICGGPVWLQIALFFVVSIVCLAATRPLVKKLLRKDVTATNADRVLGQTARVTESIDNAVPTGAVYVGGMTWTARSESGQPIPRDAQVKIVRMEGVRLFVEPV